ncbi:zinc ABC transporter substrate-binding protein [Rhodovulum visakhapatnamense]|uniref:zinc ABC transporter substrate-binding protein n=1 Tax=Rhodovulum visakhapatnamense TaxID=364297 RepID=UPI000A72A2A5|nr:zinc ABC transporter substrate-binding protein [Rhodovulum visakhapatnamense]
MRPLFFPVFLALAAPASAQPPRVVTDIPPVQSLVAAVMGDLGRPEILLDQGGDPHHFQLKPSQARAISEAGLVFWVGPQLTPWLDRALKGLGPDAQAVALIEAPGTYRRSYGTPDGHDHDHEGEADAEDQHHGAAAPDADHDADDHAAEEEHHHHEGTDPHAWLDPENARVWVLRISGALAEADPENTAIYQANARSALDRIATTEAEARQVLAPVGDRPIMVFHDAYGYFAEHFGLSVAGSIAMGDAADPGAARLTGLRDELRADGVACLFPEAQHDPAYAEAIAEGTDVRVGAPLDPSGSTLAYGPDLYPALLTGLARTIADCVTGSDG